MNIVFTRFPLESSFGGAEVQTLSLMEGLKQRGHDVSFLGSCPTLLAECEKRNIQCEKLDIGPPPVTKWGVISFLWRQFAMRHAFISKFEIRNSKFDAVIMLSLSEKLLLTPAAQTSGIPCYWIEHDRVGRWLTQNPWLPRLRKLSQHATTIVVSELSAKIYREMGWKDENLAVIPNGIDLQRFLLPTSRTPDRQEVGGRKLAIGCITRLTHDKGVDLLIHAISQVPDVHLQIIGRGPEEQKLKAQISQLSLEDLITITHHCDDLGDFYRSIDILVLPSREHDPFGLVAAEAMALGTPVIVTDACGIASYLTDGKNALIAKAGDADSLLEKIEQCSNEAMRQSVGAEGVKTAHELFSVETMVQQYDDLLRSHSPQPEHLSD